MRSGTPASGRCWRAAFRARRRDEVAQARAYAYGGAVIQDLGYYPFGSHFFSNLRALRPDRRLRRGADPRGARRQRVRLCARRARALHRRQRRPSRRRQPRGGADVSRSCARSTATRSPTPTRRPPTCSSSSRSTSCRRRAAPTCRTCTRASSASRSRSRCSSARSSATYGLEMKDVFLTEDLAIGSYRHAVSETIPEITRIAWRDKREEIEKLNPGAARGEVRLQPVARRNTTRPTAPTTRSRACWRGSSRSSTSCCRRSARCGRCSSRRRRKEAEALFLESFKDTRERYRAALDALGARAPRSAEHRLRHRQAERARRIHAGRRDLRRAAATG